MILLCGGGDGWDLEVRRIEMNEASKEVVRWMAVWDVAEGGREPYLVEPTAF